VKKQIALLLLTVYFLFPATSFAARSIMVSGDKTSLTTEDELIITASISGFTNGEKIYLKGSFFKDGSTNYFGFTKHNDSWIKNSATAINQKDVMIGSWDNFIIVRPDYYDTGYAGKGEYKFKLGFYYMTSGGNISSINWSGNDIPITLDSPPPPTQNPEPEETTSRASSGNPKTPTPTKASASSNSIVPSKVVQNFAKISHRIRTASEYAKIEPITEKEEKKKKAAVLGARDNKGLPTILFVGLVLFIAGIVRVIWRELKLREII
jgi:hypothetical protein